MKTLTLHTVLGHRLCILEDGRIADSPRVVIGAVTRGRNGSTGRRYALPDLFTLNAAIPWCWNNGAQRTYLQLREDGLYFELRSPVHWITER